MSQQAFPNPRVRHLRDATNAVRRAKMHRDLTKKIQPIAPSDVCICCHSDAAFANAGTHTQAGYILAFIDKSMHSGKVSHWTPVVWKSYMLPRAVSSTLGGESQAMATATGTVEWLNLMLIEALDGPFAPRIAAHCLLVDLPFLQRTVNHCMIILSPHHHQLQWMTEEPALTLSSFGNPLSYFQPRCVGYPQTE